MSGGIAVGGGARVAEVGEVAAVGRGGEPSWLRARRDDAWELYEATPFPSTRSEEWRYTDIERLLPLGDLERSAIGPNWSGELPERLRRVLASDGEGAGRVVEMDGRVVSARLDPGVAAAGVALSSLADAACSADPVVRELLGTQAVPASDGKFPALNAALWSDGVFVHVPPGVKVELPIRLSRWVSRPEAPTFTRVLIVAEERSNIAFEDEILSPDFESGTLVSTAVEIFARRGARVRYVSLQRMGRRGCHLANQRTVAERDSSVDTLNVALGGSVDRVDLNARLVGPGASSEMLGLYFGEDGQHFDFNTSQDHMAPHAHSDLLYKGALDGRARGIFRGIIRVHEGAQRTDAYQTNRNLLLSDHAVATSLPNLEIEADDVRCSHGATVGQLDSEAIFYLMSRGLERGQAERLVVRGFLGEVLSRLGPGVVADKVMRTIEAKLVR
ncbi:MAG: Fe-S cluster assembly protein SufD [Gemmatimonadetes bacterium]|nr:Fe-S cluster assembly protein SufD [Gemmatimonadota bacterium]MCY3944258.1 Fe-S cluster assembly protein SufD [Gemmatimonadota bacterium]